MNQIQNSTNYYCHTCKKQCFPVFDTYECNYCHNTFIEEIEENSSTNNQQNNNNLNTNFSNNGRTASSNSQFNNVNYQQNLSSNNNNITGPSIITYSVSGRSPNVITVSFNNNSVSPTNRDFSEMMGFSLASGTANNPILSMLLSNSNPLGTFFNNAGDAQFENLLNYIMMNDPNVYGTPPASEEIVKNLKRDIINNSSMKDYNHKECSICKDNYQLKETVITMPCSHKFHEDCILPWLKLHNSCPVCRYQTKTDDKEYEEKKEQNRSILRRVSENSLNSSSKANLSNSNLNELVSNRNSSNSLINNVETPLNFSANSSDSSNNNNESRQTETTSINGNFQNYHLYDSNNKN